MILRTDMLTRIQDQKIEHFFQPMWNLKEWKIFGYEALLRFSDGCYSENIERAFEVAMIEGSLFELDTLSVEKAVSCFPIHLLEDELLFLNIFPSTLINHRFERFISQLFRKYPKAKGRIVFEINESKEEESIWENPELKRRIDLVKEYGCLVALDDIGKGGAALKKIIEYSPDYIKLDRYFSQDLCRSKAKQDMISLLVQYSKGKMGLILEGIEKEIDLAQAKFLSVPVVQGYLLGRPQKVTEKNLFGEIRRKLTHLLA